MKIHFLEKRKFIIGILILLFFGIFIFFSQNLVLAQSQSTPTPISPTIISTQTILEENDVEILLLKTQLEDIKEYNKNLLSTVQWSIGIVITTLIVILGINWFTTYNQYQKEIKEYKKDLEKTISDETNKFQTNFTSTMNQKFDTLNKKDEELIRSKYSSIENEMIKIRIALSESEAKYWESIGVYSNVVTCYVDMIDLDPNHSTIQFTLSSLEKAISMCEVNLGGLTIQDIEHAMEKTITRHKILTEQVLTRLKENAAK